MGVREVKGRRTCTFREDNFCYLGQREGVPLERRAHWASVKNRPGSIQRVRVGRPQAAPTRKLKFLLTPYQCKIPVYVLAPKNTSTKAKSKTREQLLYQLHGSGSINNARVSCTNVNHPHVASERTKPVPRRTRTGGNNVSNIRRGA